MIRAAVVAGALALAAADFASFTPASVFYSDTLCSIGAVAIEQGCHPLGLTGKYTNQGDCNVDAFSMGLSICSDAACANCQPYVLNTTASCLGFNSPCACGMAVAPGSANVFGSIQPACRATPCCATTGIIVSFAVILGIGVAGMCGFWAYKDKVHKAKAAKEASDMATSIAEEKARAERTTGALSFGTTATAAGTGAHGGYSAMH